MAGISEDRDRQVVPRWRSFVSTRSHGELAPLFARKDRVAIAGALDELQADWKERQGVSTAADLVSSAFVIGREADAADAAHYLLRHENVPASARSIAALCLQRAGESVPGGEADDPHADASADSENAVSFDRRRFQVQIHETRGCLAEYPRNPVLWNNLARLYTSVGSREKATRAMRVALSLTPENRLILRGAARMLLHQGDGRQAHRLLSEARSLKSDPWILSAEIATAAAMKRTSKHIKQARKILEANRHSPLHLSELASALGTLEAIAGSRKSSRKLIGQSLQQPSENAIAQAAWLVRRVGMQMPFSMDRSRSAEANAWNALRMAKWDSSLEEARKWQADQPFSSRPAIHGSHIASTIFQDYDLAVEIAEIGLLGNPDDVVLRNNLAFALAERGDTGRAAKILQRIDFQSLGNSQQLVMSATQGLVEFRSGRPDVGREFYHRALAIARATRDPKGVIAWIYLAMEELRTGSPQSEEVRREAIEAARELSEPWGLALVDRLRKYQPETSPM